MKYRRFIIDGIYPVTESSFSCKAPEDYTEVTGLTLTFGPSVSSISVPVTIINDSISEGNQTFVGNLGSPVGAVTLSPPTATVTILDDVQGHDSTMCLCSVVRVLVVIPMGSLTRRDMQYIPRLVQSHTSI